MTAADKAVIRGALEDIMGSKTARPLSAMPRRGIAPCSKRETPAPSSPAMSRRTYD